MVGRVSFTMFVNSRTVEPMPNCVDIALIKKYLVGMRAVLVQINKKPIATSFFEILESHIELIVTGFKYITQT